MESLYDKMKRVALQHSHETGEQVRYVQFEWSYVQQMGLRPLPTLESVRTDVEKKEEL